MYFAFQYTEQSLTPIIRNSTDQHTRGEKQMNELTKEERELLEWVFKAVSGQDSVQPLESLADVCESIDLGLAPAGLERAYYGMGYNHQLIFLTQYIMKMEE